MGRSKKPPDNFVCPYRDQCPHLEGLSAFWMFQRYLHFHHQEHEHWLIRDKMAAEIDNLQRTTKEQAREIDRLRAENKLLHQRGFKSVKRPVAATKDFAAPALCRPRGAPRGHPAWNRKAPERID
jgi:hypothetical protein